MPTPQELEAKFWKALGADMTMMIGIDGTDDGHARPMTAQFENDRGPIWFFTSTDNGLAQSLKAGSRAIATYAAKDHDLFATVHGNLSRDADAATIDRLWNRYVAAWYTGKDDPKLVLLRLDPERAEIWLNESNVFAGLKMLFGMDPKPDYKDKVAEVTLG